MLGEVRRYCESKGYQEGDGINNFVPHDCVAACAMAKHLTATGNYDYYIAVAPEGHIYGYFFEVLGYPPLAVHVDYPPTRVAAPRTLTTIRGKRVLLIEDDVQSGHSLRLVMDLVTSHSPAAVDLFLGHYKGVQRIENVPAQIGATFLAEDTLDYANWRIYEDEFSAAFEHSRAFG